MASSGSKRARVASRAVTLATNFRDLEHYLREIYRMEAGGKDGLLWASIESDAARIGYALDQLTAKIENMKGRR